MSRDALLGIISGDPAPERMLFSDPAAMRRDLKPRNLYALYVVPSEPVAAALRSLLAEFGQTTPIVVDARATTDEVLAIPAGHPMLGLFGTTVATLGTGGA